MRQGLEQATYYMIKKSVDVLRNISLKMGKKKPKLVGCVFEDLPQPSKIIFLKKILCELCTFFYIFFISFPSYGICT